MVISSWGTVTDLIICCQVVAEFQQVQKGLNTVKNDLKINASDARKSIQELVASKINELKKKEKVTLF